ncbi:MAG: aminopeptidase P family N-terminal domain-containing protein, partial [Actinobacteria bacterium]|nr:aminopeptidase P family N-terminal domain-containing protein [Actinomycetota bacterium]
MTDKIRLKNISDIHHLRKKRFTSSLKKINLDYYIVLKDENILYLTGFYGKDSNSMLLVSHAISYLFVNFIYYEE